jgi:hypothetical protein
MAKHNFTQANPTIDNRSLLIGAGGKNEYNLELP